MQGSDTIRINALSVSCHVGVPDEERSEPQSLELDLALIPREPLRHLQDDLARTIDYHSVAILAEDVCQQKPRKLIETLAEDLAEAILRQFPLQQISVTVRKFILPNTRSVETSITRCHSN